MVAFNEIYLVTFYVIISRFTSNSDLHVRAWTLCIYVSLYLCIYLCVYLCILFVFAATFYGLLTIAIAFVAEYMGDTVVSIALGIFGFVGGPLTAVITLGIFCPCINSKVDNHYNYLAFSWFTLRPAFFITWIINPPTQLQRPSLWKLLRCIFWQISILNHYYNIKN